MFLIAAAHAVDRCGPSWVPRGESCGNSSCGITAKPGQPTIQPHCGWSHRSVGFWNGVLPRGVFHPSVVHEARIGGSWGKHGVGGSVMGRLRLNDFVALRVEGQFPLRGEAGVQLNLPTGERGSQLGLLLAAHWDDGWGGVAALSTVHRFLWSTFVFTHWRARWQKQLSTEGVLGLGYRAGPFSATVAGELALDLSATGHASLQFHEKRWTVALEGDTGWNMGIRVGRWHHPDRYVE